jgi:hypothetical protein
MAFRFNCIILNMFHSIKNLLISKILENFLHNFPQKGEGEIITPWKNPPNLLMFLSNPSLRRKEGRVSQEKER